MTTHQLNCNYNGMGWVPRVGYRKLTWQNVIPKRWLHADETSRVAEATAAERLISRRGVTVERQSGATRCKGYAEGVTGEG